MLQGASFSISVTREQFSASLLGRNVRKAQDTRAAPAAEDGTHDLAHSSDDGFLNYLVAA
jgi:hypothetical protein